MSLKEQEISDMKTLREATGFGFVASPSLPYTRLPYYQENLKQ